MSLARWVIDAGGDSYSCCDTDHQLDEIVDLSLVLKSFGHPGVALS